MALESTGCDHLAFPGKISLRVQSCDNAVNDGAAAVGNASVRDTFGST